MKVAAPFDEAIAPFVIAVIWGSSRVSATIAFDSVVVEFVEPWTLWTWLVRNRPSAKGAVETVTENSRSVWVAASAACTLP